VIAAYSFFIVLYAWYRGTNRMGRANLWQTWAIAVGPLAVVWLAARPGAEARILVGLALVLLVAAVPLAWELALAVRQRHPLSARACGALCDTRRRACLADSRSVLCWRSGL
jgi:hypothetical protein